MGDPSFRKVPNTYFVKMLFFWKNQAKFSVSVMTFHPKIFHPTTFHPMTIILCHRMKYCRVKCHLGRNVMGRNVN